MGTILQRPKKWRQQNLFSPNGAKGMKVVSQHIFFIRKCMIVSSMDLPSRELICPTVPPWEKPNHLQKCLGKGYASYQLKKVAGKESTPESF